MVAFFPGLSETDPGANNSDKVRQAVRTALTKMGVDCSEVGQLSGLGGFCQGDSMEYIGLSPASHFSASLLLLVVTGILSYALS